MDRAVVARAHEIVRAGVDHVIELLAKPFAIKNPRDQDTGRRNEPAAGFDQARQPELRRQLCGRLGHRSQLEPGRAVVCDTETAADV